MPSLVFLVTGWKPNGRENACLQAWASFVGGGMNDYICILGQVDQPTNPETGETDSFGPGILEQGTPVPWITR